MFNRTYTIGPCGHRVFFYPDGVSLREWWCKKCDKSFPLTPLEKRIVLVAYKHGRECGQKHIKSEIRRVLGY